MLLKVEERLETLVSHNPEWAALSLLKLLKSKYDYKSLSKLTGLPVSTLSRYCTNRTLPRGVRARKLLQTLMPLARAEDVAKERIRLEPNGEIDATQVLFNPWVLRLISSYVSNAFAGRKVTCILAADEESLSMATAIGMALDKKFTLVSRKPLWREEDSVSTVSYLSKPGIREVLWLPKMVMNQRESVLLLFSKVIDEEAANVVISAVERGRAHVSGIFALIASKESWERLSLPPATKKEALILL
ncbi:MAG: hypothetical protein OEY99_01500 [Aigarchaeota archaeon]|nr:hypothetical protein [Aigarchaeota archaeon]